ncbi:MAG: pseudouridine synthase [Myxococcota bacterium]
MAELRLQVHLSRAGVMSRRRAEAAIEEGRVAVNGVVVTQQGVKVDPETDRVELDGEVVGRPQHPATIMLHKPDGVLTTLDDPRGRETVAQLIDEPYRFVPVGRLDYHTEGLLLLSTDGTLVHRLLHPSYHVPKGYRVKVGGAVTEKTLDRLREGVELEDGPTRPALVEVLERTPRTTWLEIVVSEGRNHLVRRMVDAVGHTPRRVVRLEFGTLALEDLRPGQYRYLSPSEVDALYRTTKLPGKSQPPRFQVVGTRPLGTARRGKGKLPGQPGAGRRSDSPNKPDRKKRLTKGRARPPDGPPVEDELLGVGPKKLDPRPRLLPDGVPSGRPSGYPDTRVWRKVGPKGAGPRPVEVQPEQTEGRDRPRAQPENRRPAASHEGRARGRTEYGRGEAQKRSSEGRAWNRREGERGRDPSERRDPPSRRAPGDRSPGRGGFDARPRGGGPRRGSGRPRGGGRPGGRGSR